MSDMLEAGLRAALRGRLEALAAEEVERAKERIDKAVPGIVAGVGLELSKYMEVNTLKDRLVLTLVWPKEASK